MRIPFDELFMQVARAMAQRSTCRRRQVGAVLAMDNHIISTGYNGAPPGMEHCTDIGYCLRQQLNIPSGQQHEICRGVHAEQNAIIQAAIHGTSTKGAVIYTTHFPCSICARILVSAGVTKVYCGEGYPDRISKGILEEASIPYVFYGKTKEGIACQAGPQKS